MKILSNLRFSFSSIPYFSMFSAPQCWFTIVKTVILPVWALNFLHDFTLFVIDIHQNMSLQSFGTTFEALSKLTFWRLKWVAVPWLRPKFHNKDLHRWNWIGNLILKLVCFLQLFDLSTPWDRKMHICKCMGISMGKWPRKIKWPKFTFPGSKMVPKVSKRGF